MFSFSSLSHCLAALFLQTTLPFSQASFKSCGPNAGCMLCEDTRAWFSDAQTEAGTDNLAANTGE